MQEQSLSLNSVSLLVKVLIKRRSLLTIRQEFIIFDCTFLENEGVESCACIFSFDELEINAIRKFFPKDEEEEEIVGI